MILEKLYEKPLVSIVITTFNRVNFLKKSSTSVLSQTYKNIELIIIDDCSTDNTQAFCESIKDIRVIYLRHKTNKGVHESRNDGIRKASGQYIAFLDDDDEWLPQKIEKQLQIFKKGSEELGLVYSGYYNAIDGKIVSKITPKMKGDIRIHILQQNLLATLTVLIRRVCFDKVGFFEYMPAVEDWDMRIRISEFFHYDFVSEPLGIYNIHGSQVSGTPNKLIIFF